MPELPEVETIRRDLFPYLVGRTFTGVELIWPGAVRHPSPEEFSRRLVGETVTELRRRGKYLVFSLSGGGSLIVHLMMSGRLVLDPPLADEGLALSPPGDGSLNRYIRAVFHLEGGRRLVFDDPRKLGAIWLAEEEAAVLSALGGLGPDPLSPDFSPEVLALRLRRRTGPIKPILLNQSFVAGIGNIYADEILFASRISPQRKAAELSPQEITRLYESMKEVLSGAIAHRGTTFSDYRDGFGEPGHNQHHLKVYRRAGTPCPSCGSPIIRISFRGRGTYFCPRCQS